MGSKKNNITVFNCKCNLKRCKCCNQFVENNNVLINNNSYNIKHGGTCSTKNVIYSIKCKLCNKYYIGETGNSLNIRLNGHRGKINYVKQGKYIDNKYNDNGIAMHFNIRDHNFDQHAEIQIIESGYPILSDRRNREDFFISKFKTMTPNGLNTKRGQLANTFYDCGF